ncbi:MAG TPA: NAD(P)/FAD-dependent oxidoreductase [Anaerolineales bacterium]|nr:NAD(P)/FAD-dependent oxidoreductase [Anaerolineales bacterium]
MPANSKLPILIVGAGPVGLSLAIALLHKGLPVTVIEADAELNTQIRASTFHPPTLELFAQWGVIDPVLAAGHRVSLLQYWERQTRQCIAEFNYRLIAEDTPYPFRLQLPQHELTHLLLPIVQNHPLARVHLGKMVTSFEDNGKQVEVTVKSAKGIEKIVGSYLCGSDGARSVVRTQLGLAFTGMTYEDRFLLVGTDLRFDHIFPNIAPVAYIFDPQEWVILLNLSDWVRVVFRMKPDEDEKTAMQPQQLRARMAGLLPDSGEFPIRTLQLYRVHQRVASTFRVGRVLLAGDAAHLNNPAGGMGMNSGIHDAALLADCLARVWAGESPDLLDEYSHTRRKVALDRVQAHAGETYADLTTTDPAERTRRNHRYATLASDPVLAREYLLKASMLA